MDTEDFVIKRDGSSEPISFDKILSRVKKLGDNQLNVNYTSLVQKIVDRLYGNIETTLIDELTAQQCASLSTTHLDYGVLASRIMISNHQKNTSSSFTEVMRALYDFKDVNGDSSPLIHPKLWGLVEKNSELIEKSIDYERDYLIDYFGFKTLERAYLMKVDNKIVERPQHMWMRVSLGIHWDNMELAIQTYDLMSQKFFTHATPTLFNAGTPRPQLSSCYLLAMESDSIKGIYNTLSDCASISKWAGGIGLHIHNVRASGSHIRGTNGTSNGIVPMLRVFNNTARYVDQGGGRRKGSFAVYLEPWHADIRQFLDMKKNHGDEEARARDLFYALWIPDLFMKRVKENGKWSLMCPDKCPGLSDVYGDEFEELYTKYEKENKMNEVVNAREIWYKMLDSQIETGTPYMFYKDAANKKSNQKNIGTIMSSNLCGEIMLYSNKEQSAVCNLASVALNKFIRPAEHNLTDIKIYTKPKCDYCKLAKHFLKKNNIDYTEYDITEEENKTKFEGLNGSFKTVPQIFNGEDYVGDCMELYKVLEPVYDHENLHRCVKVITQNLNNVIDINFYPTEKTRKSNLLHRPIGIGVQGLADTFAIMNIPFESDRAKELNKEIFETIYHAAAEASCEISRTRFIKINHVLHNNKSLISEKQNGNGTIDKKVLSSLLCEAFVDEPPLIPEELNRTFDEACGSYSSFKGSPASQGLLQFDLWGVEPSKKYDWDKLKEDIKQYGMRNSTLLAPMPTASTSQILGNNECFEPFTSNIYVRRTLAGEFIVVNKYLMEELTVIGMWNEELKNNIIANSGSIQHIKGIPKFIKEKYKTVWEIPMKHLIEMSADRGAYICQSQSLNLWMKDPSYDKLTAMHFFSWSKGLKTGLYYLRSKAKSAPQQFTIEPTKMTEEELNGSDEECEFCSS